MRSFGTESVLIPDFPIRAAIMSESSDLTSPSANKKGTSRRSKAMLRQRKERNDTAQSLMNRVDHRFRHARAFDSVLSHLWSLQNGQQSLSK
jgi:hypothetical protein